jgi:hypothetical protein
MPIVSFEVKNSDGFPFLLEAHGTVKREGFGDPYHIEIDSFYISFDGEEWIEITENFLSVNVEEDTFATLCDQLEEAMIEAFQTEEGLESDDKRIH